MTDFDDANELAKEFEKENVFSASLKGSIVKILKRVHWYVALVKGKEFATEFVRKRKIQRKLTVSQRLH